MYSAKRGAAMVEATIAASAFFLLIFGLILIALLSYNRLVLAYSLSSTSRFASIAPPAGLPGREQRILDHFNSSITSLGVSPPAVVFTVCPANSSCSPGTISAGEAGQNIVLSASASLSFGMPLLGMTISDSIEVKNEEF